MKKAWLCLGVSAVILAGCGHKGPLYLPQSQKPVPEKTPKTAPASSDKPKQDSATSNP